jgi:hypothetical protein
MQAHRQWANRPADETFGKISEAIAAQKSIRDNSHEQETTPGQLKARTAGDRVLLTTEDGFEADLTNWAFRQFSEVAGAPAGYLDHLPASLAVENLNYGLSRKDKNPMKLLYTDQIDDAGTPKVTPLLRSLTKNSYTRIWNIDVLSRLEEFQARGWDCPTPFKGSNLSQSSTEDRAKTIYAGDRDMFAFLVNEDKRITEPGSTEGLARGFFVETSEVGGRAIKFTSFLYRYVCSNHMVWGADGVTTLRFKSDQSPLVQLTQALEAVHKLAESSAVNDEKAIKVAMEWKLGVNKEAVIEEVTEKLRLNVSRRILSNAYDIGALHESEDGNPRTLWGLANAITRYSQAAETGQARTTIDAQAGILLAAAQAKAA